MSQRKVYVVGVGMTVFDKPGRKTDVDYVDYALESSTKALLDAGLTYDAVQFAAVGYCYGESTSGQRAIYQLGLTQIPIVNVNNNCSTGSTALYLARAAVESGQAECAMALGFEKMAPGSLGSVWQDRTSPMDQTVEATAEMVGIAPAPVAAQIFANAGIEYCEKYAGGDHEAMHLIAEKSHNHSQLNPYAQFRQPTTLEKVKKARQIYGPLTLLHCSPTSDGSGCAILASEAFVKKHGLENQAVQILAQTMATDSTLAFDPEDKKRSLVELAGADMTRHAAADAYRIAKISPKDVGVVELHDCFSANELITYDALQLCEPGKAVEFTLSGATTLPQFSKGKNPSRRVVVNPSGGLISKGHPLGATGLAQCCELTWQLRGVAGPRQIPDLKYALQHNVGLGGAVVIGIYARGFPGKAVDPVARHGYNPAVEARPITAADVRKVLSAKGGLVGTKTQFRGKFVEEKAFGTSVPDRVQANL
ncbi:thiolase-like protein [Cladochytrium replicatum]|nr:thiolase-like protein [Cladochytrium replicatum]